MWSGEKGSELFTAFNVELQNWVGSLHDNMVRVMVAETKEGRLMELDIRNAGKSQETVDDNKATDRRLHQMLISSTKGTTAATLREIRASRRGSKWSVTSVRRRVQTGLSHAWPASQSGLMSARPKTLQNARSIVLAEFEMKCAKKVDEDTKILALKSIMPETLFGRESFFVENRSTSTRICPGSSGTGKGEGKGEGNGKTGACWKCCESDHCSRECPNDKQDNSWTDGTAWKIQKGSKAGKDAGKGWDAGKCSWNSWGHSKGKGKDWYVIFLRHNSGKERTDRVFGAPSHGKARAA